MYELKYKENTFHVQDKETFELLVKMTQTIKQQHAISIKYCDFCGMKMDYKPRHLVWYGEVKDLCSECYSEMVD